MKSVESYVLNFSAGDLDQSPASRSGGEYLMVVPEVGEWFSPSDSSSSASSSIGRNSDDDGKSSEEDGGDDAGYNEAESPYKGPLDLMESIEQVLPIRKGISKYYNGKSKSFTSLVEEAESALTSSSSSVKDLAKPENPYSRRRRNLLSHQIWENNKTTPRGGISKKHIMSSSRSALTLAMAVAAGVMTVGEGSSSSSSGGDSSSSPGSSPTNSGSPPRRRPHHHKMLPPLYPRSQGSSGFYAGRSYTVADFPRCFPATADDS